MKKTSIFSAFLISLGFLATVSLGAYLESDYDEKTPETPSRERHRPNPTPKNAVTQLIRRLDLGKGWNYRHLTIYPLTLSGSSSPSSIRTLDEAFRNKWITVREKDNAEVAGLRVRNDSKHYILMMSGEIVAGGKQNRMVKHDVLLSPNSGFINIAVYCGEQSRWAGKKTSFESAGRVAHFGLRRGAAKSESQGDIWKKITAQSRRAKVSSPTRDYARVYDDASVKKELDACAKRYRGFCGTATVGAVAVANGRIIGADIFADPALLSKLWDKLIRSYGLEAFYGPSHRHKQVSVRRFLNRTLPANYTRRSTPGAGFLLDISGPANGVALVWDGMAVHVTLFGNRIQDRPSPPPPPTPIRPWPRPPYPVPLPRPVR